MPRKTFVAGEVLAAADVNEFLADQVIMTFAGTAARGSAIASPSEGMFAYLEDSDILTVFDGSDWVDYAPASAVPGRNLLYNGAMQVAQRGTSETGITTSGYYTADRWDTTITTLGTFTQTVEADGPTGSGFTKSLKYECTTADSSPAAGDRLILLQRFEGQDLQALKYGSSSAESLTLSFWVKSNVTGTYIVELYNSDGSGAQVSASYTISSSGTWEKKTITIAGDTSNGFDNDNAQSMLLSFWLGAGSDYTSGTLNTSWASVTTANRAVGQTNLAASTSNYWQVTGVQLEAGTVATPFEHKAYGVELAECQRYYQQLPNGTGERVVGSGMALTNDDAAVAVHFVAEMRTNPSMSLIPGASSFIALNSAGSQFAAGGYAFSRIGSNTALLVLQAIDTDPLVAGNATLVYADVTGAFMTLDAEL